MSLSRETFCSGETQASASMGCQPWCHLCTLQCGASRGNSPTAVLHRGLLSRASGAVLPWAQRCSLLLAMGGPSPLFMYGGCEPAAPRPAVMHPHSHPAEMFAPPVAGEMPLTPHQAAPGIVLRGHHHLLGTKGLPQDVQIAPISL